ncbi:MAG: carboxyl transferase domain-containing protein [Chitinophagales bacterium]|nr:acyl-CoA carboxylase subunit beta [Chitinophagales bacterium]MDW8392848.1 carboxyl transferase domain-containing protein [Chitinophagales bacterium]
MKNNDLQFNKNDDAYRLLLSEMRRRLDLIRQGGGKKNIDRQHERGKMTARERIAYLLDRDQPYLEIGAFAAYDMYAEHGGCPAAGVIVVLGYVSGRLCIVVANDATVKAGAWFPLTTKKNLRAQELAMENRLPIIYLVDSAGVFLPMQDEIFPDKEHFGRIFRNNAVMSAEGIPQIAAIMGSCVAGGAYLPIMSDEALIVKGTGSVFLAGPYLVKAAIGEDTDIETLGGATTHCEISGVTDYACADDRECLDRIRSIVDKLGPAPLAGLNRSAPQPPALAEHELLGFFPTDNAQPYDTYEILRRLTDRSELDEYKPGYGKTIICAYARIDGWAVGIVANQRKVVKSRKGEMQFGGVIYSDSADKAARFVMNCNQKRIPLVFVQDVTGFMVGTRSEHGGIIKDGAKLVNAVANSVVPKITVITGNSYGAGNYAMCGKAYDPRFIFGWPTARIAVMGGDQAARTLLQIQETALKARGQTLDEKQEKALLEEIRQRYEQQTTAYYAAARLWIDAILDPLETRKAISLALSAANHAPIDRSFRTGVIQT